MKPDLSEIAQNYVDLHRVFSKLLDAKILDRKSFVFYANPDSDWFTRIILKKNPDPQILKAELEELRKLGYKSDILDFLNIRDHEPILNQIGYDSCNEQVGMFLSGNPNYKNENVISSKLDFRKIRDKNELKVWLKIVNESFHSDDRENLYLRLLSVESFSVYAGFFKNTLVTTGMTFYNGRSYGLYSITTDPQYRGFGYASEIVRFILNQIRSEFSGIVILHATDMGKGIYKKLGFEKSILLRHWSSGATPLEAGKLTE
ncbi:GNAT family N-acetyltransferase [Leptospira sp. WS92.C1]